jgi:hypothetical protein
MPAAAALVRTSHPRAPGEAFSRDRLAKSCKSGRGNRPRLGVSFKRANVPTKAAALILSTSNRLHPPKTLQKGTRAAPHPASRKWDLLVSADRFRPVISVQPK